jgi:hypothetical protein
MKTPIHVNSKGNEINAQCSLKVQLCFILSNHHCQCYCQCSLHHICASWVNNDDIHQGPKDVFSDKDIHLSSSVVREKVGDLLLNMCSTFQNNSSNSISNCIVGYYMFTPIGAP